MSLQVECNVENGFTIEEPFGKFGWTFFNIKLSNELVSVIEKSRMMEGATGFKISEQITTLSATILKEREAPSE